MSLGGGWVFGYEGKLMVYLKLWVAKSVALGQRQRSNQYSARSIYATQRSERYAQRERSARSYMRPPTLESVHRVVFEQQRALVMLALTGKRQGTQDDNLWPDTFVVIAFEEGTKQIGDI